MGGSGTSYPFKSDPKTLAEILRESEEKATNQKFEITINEKLDDLLNTANQRNTKKITDYLSQIRDSLEAEIDGTINIRYGGSVAKHTYVDGFSDIDTLALLNNSELRSKSPEEVKEYFLKKLQKNFPTAEIRKGDLAVTIIFKDKTEIQTLPALKTQNGYKIQSSSGENKWTKIEPQHFAKSLRAINIKTGGKLIPIIKLIKSIIYQLPEKRRMTGYHIEASAIEIFKNYMGSRNKKEMLKHYFEKVGQIILTPIKDKTGQSLHVDDYAGPKHSLVRRLISDSLSNIKRKMLNADATSDIDYWNNLLAAN